MPTIADFLGLDNLSDESLEELEFAIKTEKERFGKNCNGSSQRGELNNFFGKTHSAKSKMKMRERAKLRGSNRTGKTHSEESKMKMRESALGRKLSEQTRRNMSISKINSVISEETKLKISAANKGKTKPVGYKEKMSEIAKNRKKVRCEYCEMNLDVSNYTRWHGKNCKSNPNVV